MAETLDGILEQYRSDGFKDVAILTVKTEANSFLAGKAQDGQYKKTYTFTTCRKFKGLEAEVVILIDVDKTTFDSQHILLFYVGASRARTRLEIITDMTDEDCEGVLREALHSTGTSRTPRRKLASDLNAIALIPRAQ